jgi:hypothetical protein
LVINTYHASASIPKHPVVLSPTELDAARMMGLEINQAKTKYMICGTKRKYVENVFKVKHMSFERVNSFVYLGTLNTAENNVSAEINTTITLANRSYFGMVNTLKAKNINRKHKVIIYKTLVKPVMMYGVKTWVLSMADELRLGVFERKILRRIYGPSVKSQHGDQGIMKNCMMRLTW